MQRTLAYADQQARDGARLRERRKELKLTQREVAALTGVTSAAIGAMERGYGSLDLRRAVSAALESYRRDAVTEWPERASKPAPARVNPYQRSTR